MNPLRTGLLRVSKSEIRRGQMSSIEMWEQYSLSHVAQNMQIRKSRDNKMAQ